MELNKIHVVEYSVNQGAYHLHTLDQLLNKNNQSVMSGFSCDYIPIGFFQSDTEADNFIEWHRSKIQKRLRTVQGLPMGRHRNTKVQFNN